MSHVINHRYTTTKSRAKEKVLDFELTREFLMDIYNEQKGLCFYTLLEMRIATEGIKNPYNLSVERKDSNKGYTKENVVLCCDIVNIMKNNSSIEEFLFFCQKVIDRKEILLK